MLQFEEALRIITENATVLKETIKTGTGQALGKVLAKPVFSDIDMPPFNKSAVDGFACKREDIDKELTIVEEIPAGKFPEKIIGKGEAARIMTGSVVPEGSDYVFMIEDSEITDDGKVRFTGKTGGANICFLGEDVRKNDLILEANTRIEPQHIACLAELGVTDVEVFRQIKCGVISTGNELVEPDQKPTGASIRNSNAWQLMAQVRKAGAVAEYFGIATDTEESLEKIISSAVAKNDIVILSGGVSMGDYDHVPAVIKKLGFDIHVRSVAIQPGKPVVFAGKEEKYIFGLPGNPVSSFVIFEMFVKAFIKALNGEKQKSGKFMLTAGTDFSRKKFERMAFIPVEIKDGKAWPVEYHGSAHISAYAKADAMGIFMPGIRTIGKGELIDVRPL